jgi:COMPASS component BRE2
MSMLVENPNTFISPPASDDGHTTKSSALLKNTSVSRPNRGKRSNLAHPRPKLAEPVLRALPLKSSVISFFINGGHQGVAFEDVYSYLQLPQPNAWKGAASGKTNAFKERENHFDDGILGYFPFISLR